MSVVDLCNPSLRMKAAEAKQFSYKDSESITLDIDNKIENQVILPAVLFVDWNFMVRTAIRAFNPNLSTCLTHSI